MAISFFDDGEDTETRPSTRARPPASSSAAAERRPRPREPRHAGPGGADQHTLMVRRRWAAVIGVVLLIVIVLVVNGCLKSHQTSELKEYNHQVSALAQESITNVAEPLFTALTGAGSKTALNVQEQVDQLRIAAQQMAEHAKGLSVPGEMTEAQRNLLLTLNLRVEALGKIAGLLPAALGGQGKAQSTMIAGAMEIFLASDVLYSQRVVPLIQETLAGKGISGESTAASRFLPNLGWLEPNIVYARLTGQSAAQSNQPVSGNHGSALVGVAVGTNKLEVEPTINHISGGGSPTFTATVEDSGEFTETNVKVDIVVSAGGKQYKASHVIDQTTAGNKVNVEIPVNGVPLGVASKIEVNVEGVPGENDLENNKGTYLAIFSQ